MASARAAKRRKVAAEKPAKPQKKQNSTHAAAAVDDATARDEATDGAGAAEAAEAPSISKAKTKRRTRQAAGGSEGAAGEEHAAAAADPGKARRATRAAARNSADMSAPADHSDADGRGTVGAKRRPPQGSAPPSGAAAEPKSRCNGSAAGNRAAGTRKTGEAAPMAGANKPGKGRKRKADAVQARGSPDEHDADDVAADSDAAEAQELSLDTVGGKKSAAGDLHISPSAPCRFSLKPVRSVHSTTINLALAVIRPLSCQSGQRWQLAHLRICDAAEVSDKASPTKGVRFYDALKAKRWHPDFRHQDVTVAAVRGTLAAARQSPLWAPGGKKAPSSAAIASASSFPATATFVRPFRHRPEAQLTQTLTLANMRHRPSA